MELYPFSNFNPESPPITTRPVASVTDLAKICHFVTPLKNFGHFERVHLVFGQISRLFWQIVYAIWQSVINVNGQKLNKQSSYLATLPAAHGKCDQIGQFLKVLGNKLSFISSPNICTLFGLLLSRPLFRKNCFGYLQGNYWKLWVTLIPTSAHTAHGIKQIQQ